ncbi:hypothetical protein [Methanoregula sp.]|uniref:hypothetical protein n=1 Tax=Methanoregula sp. TaxID=2052170 RepID=UPI003C726C89
MVINMMSKLSTLKLSDLERIDLPTDEIDDFTIDKEDRKQFDPEVRDILIREKIRRAIRKYGENGLSIDEIMEVTKLSRYEITKHLEKLNNLREIYSQRKNAKSVQYYPNGKPLHQLGIKKIGDGNPLLEICIAQGAKESLFFYIVEKRYTILDGEVAEGAVMIPFNKIDEFIRSLMELKQSVEVDNL